MSRPSELTTDSIKAVRFGFYTDEEVKLLSVVKITNPDLVDTSRNPILGGLYDPSMGPIHRDAICTLCEQLSHICTGHFGHIDLVSIAYNPLLFNTLSNILNKTCFKCFHFLSKKTETDRYVTQLELIEFGDLAGAKELVSGSSSEGNKDIELADDTEDSENDTEDSENDTEDSENDTEDSENDTEDSEYDPEDSENDPEDSENDTEDSENDTEDSENDDEQTCWSSAQISEAMSVMRDFFKRKEKKCMNCATPKGKITKPIFGWFRVAGDSMTAESNSVMDTSNNNSSGHLLPSKVRDILIELWRNEAPFCSYISDIQNQKSEPSGNKTGYSMFFLQTILVHPTRFRLAYAGSDNSETTLLRKVLKSNIELADTRAKNSESPKVISCWMKLQQSINVYFNKKNATSLTRKYALSGICQHLDGKHGIFRKNMMSKTVNFTCRSVITPDPYLFVNEIGVPRDFAVHLTYPERVTPWNAEKMRGAVVNGVDIHPGANFTCIDDAISSLRGFGQINNCAKLSKKLSFTRGYLCGDYDENGDESNTVFRHLQDGDIVLVNRTPTLQKPSIMAHVVRVLHGERTRTLSMHYANCSSYNANFDGDEINVHFPQDEISRAEAYNIVNANEQYIVPTSGDPVRGLIEDHIVAAVLLTMKNTLVTRTEFSQLLYGSGVYATGAYASGPQNHSRKITLVDSEGLVESVLPTMWKPGPFWTGKQVITALLNHITRGCAPLTVEKQVKIPKNYFCDSSYTNGKEDEDHNAEHNLLVWKNELVRGVIDKAQFEKFGLVHTVQELYGSNAAGIFLSALSRLLTTFLQIHGFTCGLDDLMILPNYDAERKDELEGKDVGEEVHCDFVNFKLEGLIDHKTLQLEIEKVICRDRESSTASLDMKMKNKLRNKLTTEGTQKFKQLMTAGLVKPFPENCFSVMTTTGAKGSTVNFQKMSAYLGQQELEGKRVPRMVSGKTLPSFPAWDFASRAGGFITDRFFTGLRPQEYYFNCMAGREGLLDTLKTPRSFNLQRCLVKNLESLKVCYDHTVRDADSSIIQFHYGEDGIDVQQSSFLKNFKALHDNQESFCKKFQNNREFSSYITKLPEGLEEEARHFVQEQNKSSRKQNISSAAEDLYSGHKAREKEKLLEEDKFLELVKQKYLSSLAQPGEPVGVIAAQSVVQPLIQMTLNTFHLAGLGEMNVTLGIQRLEEILMYASKVIKTPFLTCPFSQWRSKHEVESFVSHATKVSVADLMENMLVQKCGTVYKLKMNLKHSNFVSLDNVQEVLKTEFLYELEDAIERHVLFLSRISGVKKIASKSRSTTSNEADNDDHDDSVMVADEADGSPEGEESCGDGGDDLGSDPVPSDDDLSSPDEGSDGENIEDNEPEDLREDLSDKRKDKRKDKRIRRSFSPTVCGTEFEVSFKFDGKHQILIAPIVQNTAEKVYIRESGKVSQCKMVQYDLNEKTVMWDDTKKTTGRNNPEENDTFYWAAKASGDNLTSFMEMHQDDLDLNRLYSNNVNAMLKTYGVEAARATIIRELKQVLETYELKIDYKIDYRHLCLIADYMTHTGSYLPMSRHGAIKLSSSPFTKMSFEAASKFLVEAASHGLTDDLESLSSRVILGLPSKIGTGCFDLMHKFELGVMHKFELGVMHKFELE